MNEPIDHDALAAGVLRAKPVLFGKLARACDVDEDGARAALREVIRFLDLCAQAGHPLTPSPRVDDAWHEFVLCTREYDAFCREHFGRFVHHDPGGSEEDNRRQFQLTLRAYALRFGDPDPAFWGAAATNVPSANCGGCESPE